MSETKTRMQRRLMNIRSELDGIATMIDVNLDEFEDDRKSERFLKETRDELAQMANRIDTLFTDTSEKLS